MSQTPEPAFLRPGGVSPSARARSGPWTGPGSTKPGAKVWRPDDPGWAGGGVDGGSFRAPAPEGGPTREAAGTAAGAGVGGPVGLAKKPALEFPALWSFRPPPPPGLRLDLPGNRSPGGEPRCEGRGVFPSSRPEEKAPGEDAAQCRARFAPSLQTGRYRSKPARFGAKRTREDPPFSSVFPSPSFIDSCLPEALTF